MRAWGAAGAALAACAAEPEGPPCPVGGEPTVEVGTGEFAFEPIGETLPFYQGPQGGYHVYGAVRTTVLFPGDRDDPFGADSPLVSFRLYLDGDPIAEVPGYHRYLAPNGAGGAEGASELVVIDDPDPLAFDGRAVALEVTVVDRCGLSGTDQRESTLAFDSTQPY